MIRIFIVDDSATARKALELAFTSTKDFVVIGSAPNGNSAVPEIQRLRPDIVSLDTMMPGMVPAQVVGELLAAWPVPIILVSGGSKDTTEVFDALAAGALDFVHKPNAGDAAATSAMIELFRALSKVKVRSRAMRGKHAKSTDRPQVVVIASSTGGPNALQVLLSCLTHPLPVPVIIAQHMSPGFELGLAAWLSQSGPHQVRLAHKREHLVPGQVLLGVPNFDLVVVSKETVESHRAEARGFHPSGDELFASAASVFGDKTIGLVLSGIGNDGARGAQAIVSAGGTIFAQNRETSAVYGMPARVSKLGLVSVVGSPENLARDLWARLTKDSSVRHR